MINYKDLLNIQDEKVYEFYYDDIKIEDNIFILGLKKVDGYFIFYYDESDDLMIEYKIVGKMVCPDAYTLEPVEVDFCLDDSEKVISDCSQEGVYLDSKTSEIDLIKQLVLPIVPIKVVKNEKIEYPRGDGWSIVKECDLKVSDPRLDEFKKISCKGEK